MIKPTDIIDRLFLVEDTPVGRRKWRLTISLVMLYLVSHAFWACGLVPGTSGFALASDQQALSSQVTSVRIQLLDRDILETKKEQCGQPNKTFFTKRLKELEAEWYRLTNRPYIMPECEDL